MSVGYGKRLCEFEWFYSVTVSLKDWPHQADRAKSIRRKSFNLTSVKTLKPHQVMPGTTIALVAAGRNLEVPSALALLP